MNSVFKYKSRIVFSVWSVIICLIVMAQVRISSAQNSSVISFSIPVNIDSAAVYAGPGINYYKTSVLTRGDTVEVFLRNSEGWCAIRPPEGSFSWVNAKFVRKNADNVGSIVSDSPDKEVPIRVGGPSIMKSSVIQVGMSNGKLVKILGEMALPGGTNWYKISPPPGEFRWIHEKALMQDETIAKLPTQLTLARKNLGSMSEGKLPPNSASEIGSTDPTLHDLGNKKAEISSVPSAASEKNAETSYNSTSDLTASGAKSTEEFYRELSGLNNEFFNAVNKGSSDAFYQDLSDRSAFLFQSAKNNEQRATVKQLYDNIETQRKLGRTGNVTSESSPDTADLDKVSFQTNTTSNTRRNTTEANNESSRFGRMEFAFSGRNSNGLGNIFRKPSRKSPDNDNSGSYNTGSGSTTGMTNDNGLSRNYISGSNPNSTAGQSQSYGSGSRGIQRNYNRTFWGTSTPNLVPPPSYLPAEAAINPDGANLSPFKNNTSSQAKPSVPELTDSLFAMTDDSEEKNNSNFFKSSGQIRQVAAEMTSNKEEEKKVTKWRIPSTGKFVSDSSSGSESSIMSNFQQYHTQKQPTQINRSRQDPVRTKSQTQNDLSKSSQRIVDEAVRKKTFDAIGRLGYFPNPPEGCPPYVLVQENNGSDQIVCYLETESGQKLDQFVGKTIGVKGKKGVIRRGDETKPYCSAHTIFSIK